MDFSQLQKSQIILEINKQGKKICVAADSLLLAFIARLARCIFLFY